MTAIWPAGPPNVWSEMRNHAHVALRKGTTSRTGSLTGHILADIRFTPDVIRVT
jgi:hypothetical protein